MFETTKNALKKKDSESFGKSDHQSNNDETNMLKKRLSLLKPLTVTIVNRFVYYIVNGMKTDGQFLIFCIDIIYSYTVASKHTISNFRKKKPRRLI